MAARVARRLLPGWAGSRCGGRGLSSSPSAGAVQDALLEIGAGPPRVAALAERAVLRLAGEDTLTYLQGLVTSDTRVLATADSASQYSALLSPQGRVLHDVMLHRVPDGTSGHSVLADVDAAGAEELLRLLKRYRLRAKVDISDATGEYDVRALFGSSVDQPPPGGGWRVDPRVPSLGHRMIFPAGELPPLPPGAQEATPGLYRTWRVAWGVAEGGQEMPKGEALPLEYNLDRLQAISFSKGCYVGQELTARTHFRGVIRKRVVPVAFSGEAVVGAEVSRASGGKPVGTVRAVSGGVGLAHLRMDPVLAGEPLVAQGGAAIFPAVPPAWWPEEWATPPDQ